MGSAGSTPIRVLVADGHALLREGVAALLAAQPDLQLVAEAGDAGEALRVFGAAWPDIALVDVQLPGGGLEVIAEMHRQVPGVRIVALSAAPKHPSSVRALELGASVCLGKATMRVELVGLLRAMHADARRAPIGRAQAEGLSARERDVLRAVAAGNANRRIAILLGISEDTVRAHMRSILSKLGAQDRTHAVMIAFGRGDLDLEA